MDRNPRKEKYEKLTCTPREDKVSGTRGLFFPPTHSSSISVPHSKSSLKIFFEEGKNLWIKNWKLLTVISAMYMFYQAFFKLKFWHLLSVCVCACANARVYVCVSMGNSEDIWDSALTFHHAEAGTYCFCHSANWLVSWPISPSLSHLSEH